MLPSYDESHITAGCNPLVGADSAPGSVVGKPDAAGGAGVIPVVATNNNGVGSNIASRETEVVRAEGAVVANDVAEVVDDVRVIADLVTRDAAEIVVEVVEARVELLEDDGLGLDFADLLGDDALGHFLEDNKTLLDDLDSLGVANNHFLLLNDLVDVDRGVKVVGAVEVVEVVQRLVASPVVERDCVSATGYEGRATAVLDWSGHHSGNESSEGNSDLGEHDDN